MRLIKAIKLASEKHKYQKRKSSGVAYIEHPFIVSTLIAKYKGDSKHIEDLQIAALLHDTLEDTEISYAEIEDGFGPLVASIVMELTSSKEVIKELGKDVYLTNKMIYMSNYGFILKLLDRFSNIIDNPSLKSVEDTIKMMEDVRNFRSDISERQKRIINDILTECSEFIKSKKTNE